MIAHAMLPHFTLDAQAGEPHSFPSSRPTMLCFLKEDCPTCVLSMPLIESASRAFDRIDGAQTVNA